MLKHHLKLAFRHLVINKKYSTINITGLSIGFSVVILIGLFVHRELSYDNFHKQVDNIYHLESHFLNDNQEIEYFRHISLDQARYIIEEIPEVKKITLLNYSRLNEDNGLMLSYNNNNFKTFNLAFCDSAFNDLFDFQVINGDIKYASSVPNSIILTASLSKKIFGEEDPIGKVIHTRNTSLKVNALLEDPPDNSTIQFSGLISYESAEQVLDREITDYSNKAFLLLGPEVDFNELSKKMKKVFYGGIRAQRIPQEMLKRISFNFLPFKDLYYRVPTFYEIYNESLRFGNKNFTYIMFSVGLVIFLLAIINFINISIAQISSRVKEIGIRKISGAGRFSLNVPFVLESVILCLLALFISRILVEFTFGIFNNLIDHSINSSILINIKFVLLTVATALIIGLIAGIIPLGYIARYNTIKILKEEITKGQRGILLRKVLITFQFSITIILLASILLIKKQLIYVQQMNVGFEKENCMEVSMWPISNHMDAFKNDVLQWPLISGYSLSSMFIGSQNEWSGKLQYENEVKEINYYVIHCDAHFVEVMGLEIISGRNFSKDLLGDMDGYILNETAVKEYGLDFPLEATINDHPIVGIIKDFNMQSLHSSIEPVALLYRPKNIFKANIKLHVGNSENIVESLNYIQGVWSKYTDEPFEYNFMDQRIDQLYLNEKKQFETFSYFSIIAVVLAGLGLFGVSMLSIEKRTKEVGIRKINGANVFNILKLLFKDFITLVIISLIIATPVAWIILLKWLDNFAYKTALSWWIFIVAGIMSVLIALFTIFWQSYLLARKNPIESIRYE